MLPLQIPMFVGHAPNVGVLVGNALNRIDVPVLILDCDIIDNTITPDEELREKLKQFFELGAVPGRFRAIHE